mmetsp:Transcript_23386/g.38962  ORF Transcript_23386/g.38962 Transcript_23386/m.38962 type:complete len:829 (+) Transcript_23386:30-2516(+)
MNVLKTVLKAVPRDADGFEDVDNFWTATDKLTFPLDNKLKQTILKSPSKTTLPRSPANEPTTDFNYDTSDSISDDEEEKEDDDDNDDDDIDEDPDSTNSASALNKSSATKSSLKHTPKSTRSSNYSTLNESLIDSIGLSPAITETDKSSVRRSSLKSNASSVAASNLSTSGDVDSDLRDSYFNADRSNSMEESRDISSRAPTVASPSSSNKTSKSMSASDTGGSARSHSLLNNSLLDSAGADLNDTVRSNKRVSFGENMELSPIGRSDISGSGRSRREGSTSSSRSTSKSNSAVEGNDDNTFDESDNNYDDDGGMIESDGEEEEDESVRRMASQTETPTSSRSNRSRSSNPGSSGNRSGRGSRSSSGASAMKTPLETTASSRGSGRTSTGQRSYISTPGSSDFQRGRQLADDTFVGADAGEEEDDDDLVNTDREDDPDASARKNRSDTSMANTTLDESSFVDNSLLYQISSANKKYVDGRKELQDKKKPGLQLLKQRNQRQKRKRKDITSDDEEEEEEQDDSNDDSYENDEDHDPGVRRSRRATRGRRFEFWKGERPVYQEGTMVGLLTAAPTPAKSQRTRLRLTNKKRNRVKSGSSSSHSRDDDQGDDAAELPPVRLPSNVSYLDRADCDRLVVWDDYMETQEEMKVVCPAESLQPALELPKTAKRPPGRDKVGFAAHSFNVPEVPGIVSGWISGFVDLPPEAIKDAEGVGKYAQVFFVSDCQDGAVELGIAHPNVDVWDNHTAQRLLLRKGDSFFVPPGNIYRLENHSSAKSCMLFWTIIKPIEEMPTASAEPSPSSTKTIVAAGGSGSGGGAVRRRRAELDEEDM